MVLNLIVGQTSIKIKFELMSYKWMRSAVNSSAHQYVYSMIEFHAFGNVGLIGQALRSIVRGNLENSAIK